MNEAIKLITAFWNPKAEAMYGVSQDGSLWWYRDTEYRKQAGDTYAGEVGTLLYPVGWYPVTMRSLVSVGDYRSAGVVYDEKGNKIQLKHND